MKSWTRCATSEKEEPAQSGYPLRLLNNPVPATNDLTELKTIRFRLFQDVYEWAGQLRTVNVKKDVPGADFLLPYGFIELAAANCFQDLATEEHLKRSAISLALESGTFPVAARVLNNTPQSGLTFATPRHETKRRGNMRGHGYCAPKRSNPPAKKKHKMPNDSTEPNNGCLGRNGQGFGAITLR